MQQQTLRLDEEHRYFVGEQRVPGFTEILRALGIGENHYWTEAGRDLGSALHLWTIFLARGEEPEADPDPRIAGRVAAFRKFLAESAFKLVGGEEPQFDSVLRFCCTPDLYGYLGAFAVVVDVKAGAQASWHKLQTGAQKIALSSNGFKVQKRYSLYLRDDGSYRLEEHTDTGDETRWRALVAAFHAKSHYGEAL